MLLILVTVLNSLFTNFLAADFAGRGKGSSLDQMLLCPEIVGYEFTGFDEFELQTFDYSVKVSRRNGTGSQERPLKL